MQSTILLSSNENTKQIEEEEKSRFVRSILEEIGLPIEGIWDENDNLSVENKIKLRRVLATYEINVLDDSDGNLQIYVKNEMIGEWKKCEYILKRDYSEIDPKKHFYLEMKVNSWSLFESKDDA